MGTSISSSACVGPSVSVDMPTDTVAHLVRRGARCHERHVPCGIDALMDHSPCYGWSHPSPCPPVYCIRSREASSPRRRVAVAGPSPPHCLLGAPPPGGEQARVAGGEQEPRSGC